MSKILSKGKKNKILIDQMDKIGGDFTIQFNSDIAKENDGTRVSFYANIVNWRKCLSLICESYYAMNCQ